MPSIFNIKARRALRYLNMHGFSNINLTVYIMDFEPSLDQIVSLEQYLIDSLKPNLIVDLVASSSGYREPMSQEIRKRLRKLRGTPVYVYDAETLGLLYIFEYKRYMYDAIGIYHKTLNDCLNSGSLYLDRFFFH